MCELANAECVGRATAAAGALTTTLISPTADVSALGSKSSWGGGGRGGAGRHRVLRDARKSIKKELKSASLEWTHRTHPLTTFSLLFRRVLLAEPRSTFSGPRLDSHQQSHAAPGPL